MVSKSFDINTSAIQPFDSAAKKLLVELSGETVTVILTDRQRKNPEAVESFHGKHDTAESWEAMVQQSRLLSFTDLETQVIVGYRNMMPIPASLYAPQLAASQLELYFGTAAGLFTSGDVMKQAGMVAAWQVPLEEHDFLVNHFQWLQTKHAVTVLLEAYRQLTAADGHVLVYANSAWIILWQQGAFSIARPLEYSKPDDLSWYLLDTCRQFELEPTAVNWKVSGMIEEGSSLWQAITRFVDPVAAMQSEASLQDLPPHYFAHLFKLL